MWTRGKESGQSSRRGTESGQSPPPFAFRRSRPRPEPSQCIATARGRPLLRPAVPLGR